MNIPCKICGAASRFLCNTHNQHSSTRTISHYRCTQCGAVFVGNKVTSDELSIAYSTLDSTSYYEETKHETTRKLEISLADLETLGISKDATLLDIGTGNGRFLEMLYGAGFRNIAGHEIPGSEALLAKKYNITLYHDFDYKSIPSGIFDCVTLLDVAEHVIDPHYLFDQCNRVLKDTGIVYFHTPVVTKTDRLMHLLHSIPPLRKIGTTWQIGRTSIFHLQNYTPESLHHILMESEFGDVSIIIRNELSWPVSRYVRVYLCENQGLPTWLAPAITPVLWPILATNLFNPNKAIVTAKKKPRQALPARAVGRAP